MSESLLTVLRGIRWLSSEISSAVFLDPFFFYLAQQPPVGQGLLIHEVFQNTLNDPPQPDPSGQVISSSQRPLPDNTQHSIETNIHAPGGIRTHNLSRRAASDLRLRPRGHWDRLLDTNSTHRQLTISVEQSLQRRSSVQYGNFWHLTEPVGLSSCSQELVIGTRQDCGIHNIYNA